ncbi:hypothetical protein COCVIDRAFT_41324 [Bipolaris victoriae FI3]|uniref:Uncharacterized protein n=2 Tax=Bipolaris TaxID=33194 RepID=W6YTR8_COCC2|nr:uncharacterized protein COCCADRAFT_32170 [Bipolaris zeicola 26-R-13]XP_014552526.1 hypothetical protein COCVIDRAFT_41324 [Bipolaris victoriae FI3]EUC38809.1 hypothetical protein COCCADRAFT_32170 [Bipolaris zeicola 26-R-13]
MLTPYAQKPNSVSKPASGKTSPSTRSALRQMSPNRRHTVGPSTAEQVDNDTTDASALIFSLTRHLRQDSWQEQGEFLMKTRRIRVSCEKCKTRKESGGLLDGLHKNQAHLHRRHITRLQENDTPQ